MEIPSREIQRLNIVLKIALEGNALNLADTSKIAIHLVEKLNEENIDLIISKLKQLNKVNESLLYMLKLALKSDLSEIKKRFIENTVTESNMYLYNCKFDDALKDFDMTKNFINNTLNIYNVDVIDQLMSTENENIVFNMFRKSTNPKVSSYIKSIRDKFSNENIKFLLDK